MVLEDILASFSPDNLDYPGLILRTILSLVMLVALVVLSRWQRLQMGKMFLTSYVRGLVQILLMGSVLIIIFSLENLVLLFLILLFMCFFAAWTISRRYNYPNMFRIEMYAITAGGILVMVFVTAAGIVEPKGEFIIPMGSMTISNAMVITGIAMERIFSDIKKSRGTIEAALALGDTPRNAVSKILQESMRAGLVPSTNRMAILGVVSIPGLMAGMIIGGANPVEAAAYQIIIFLMILSSGFIGEVVVSYMFVREFFNADDALNTLLFDQLSQ